MGLIAVVEGVETPVIVVITLFTGGVGVALRLLWSAFLDRLKHTEEKLAECEQDRQALWERVNELAVALAKVEGQLTVHQQLKAGDLNLGGMS